MIKAIIFDCFGVLVGDSLGDFYKKHLKDNLVMTSRADVYAEQSNAGLISYQDFIDKLAEISGLERTLVAFELDNHPKNNELFQYIRSSIKDRYRLGFLSNASDDWLSELFKKDEINLFDDVILSYKVGMIKPSLEIFKLAASNLGVEPEECVFIDDLDKYLVGAKELGMKTILYKDFESFMHELERILIGNT